MKNFDISLYGILDPEHCRDRDIADLAVIAADNGATILQYRDKVNDTRHMVATVTAILDALGDSDVRVIVNDRVDVALAAGAHGIHLGPSDMDAGHARRIMGDDAIIGLSVKTLEGAESLPADLIDYAFVGGVFETRSKNNPAALGIDGWKARTALIRQAAPGLPVGAIAGMTAGNCGALIRAGADGIAAISALFAAEDVAQAVKDFRIALEEAREAGRR
ncbi:MAG: thiamine phosphate synthase [Nitratireductor sp.]|nr:thiamine phosphate synthase [Nitratireductor sp.]